MSRIWLGVFAAIIFVCGVFAGGIALHFGDRLTKLLTPSHESTTHPTNLYSLRISELRVPAIAGRDGGIAPLRDGVLAANRLGEFWFVTNTKETHKVGLRAPLNYDDFESDPDLPRDFPAGLERLKLRFAVKDILVEEASDSFSLYVSYHHWDAARNCVTLRLSKAVVDYAVLNGDADKRSADWKVLFETTPCLPLVEGKEWLWAEESGGRIVRLTNGSLLLSVGDHGFAGFQGGPALAQQLDNSYGKTIRIDEDGTATTFTIGHRNPQGLAVSADGTIFLTEHGSEGGDEINVLKEGSNYGWPIVTYGRVCSDLACSETRKDDLTISTNRQLGEHEGFEKPIFTWVPSIAVSNVISVTKDLFTDWKGDLIVASLKAGTLFRVRMRREGRVIYVEPLLNVGDNIRDVIEASDGTIVLKREGGGGRLVYLEPVELTHLERLVAQCSGCHTMTKDGPHGIGPNLFGIVGRPIASAKSYSYSESLGKVGGVWTVDTLSAFLAEPNDFAPGNKMAFQTTLSADDIRQIVPYLESLE